MAKARKHSPYLEAYIKKEEDLLIAIPSLALLMENQAAGFRGLTIFLGDNNNLVVGVKRFAEDGTAEVIWSSGEDWVSMWTNLDAAIDTGKWRLDKRFTK